MSKNRARLFLLAAIVWSLIPLVAFAQGLVPCSGLDCQACHIAKLAQNVINFLVVVAIPIAAAIFAAAGFLYFTSGANPKHIELAKSLFWNAFIGFLVAISAWLVVQTILRVTLSNEFYRGWNTIQCTTSTRLMNKTVGEFLSTLPGLNTVPIQTSVGTPQTISDLWGPDLINRNLLETAGISVNGPASQTSLAGMQPDTLNDIINLRNTLGYSLVVTGGTEPGHQNPCHAGGTCLDFVTADRSLMGDPNVVNTIIRTSASVGRCPVFEPGPGGSCTGITRCQANVGTAPHFSFYSC